jgi:hypothetical protein
MDAATRTAVRGRANDRCEYCLRQSVDSPLIPLQIEHVLPKKHGGGDEVDNLALACAECNLHKGPNLTGIDPESNRITPLFDPRRDRWDDHFVRHGSRIVGRTAVGRTTVRVLDMNSPARLRVRMATDSG